MVLRKRYLPWLACVAMGGVAVPAIATGSEQPAPGQIRVVDFGFENPATGESLVTINAGETVTFSYPEGGSSHNVDFLTIAPTTWAQTAGAVAGAVPPLPAFPSPPGWAGVCRFDTRSR